MKKTTIFSILLILCSALSFIFLKTVGIIIGVILLAIMFIIQINANSKKKSNEIDSLEITLQEFVDMSEQDLEKIMFLQDMILDAGGEPVLNLQNQIADAKNNLVELEEKIDERENFYKNREKAMQSVYKKRYAELENIYNQKQEEFENLKQVILQKQQKILSLDDELELESFALYEPIFSFAHSTEYKIELGNLRDKEKQIIKSKKAVFVPQHATLTSTPAQGKQILHDLSKLLLRSFNESCDAYISHVKANNIDIYEKRILESFNTSNELASSLNIYIEEEYLLLKIEELHLAYEYSVKQEQEKEEEQAYKRQVNKDKNLNNEFIEKRKVVRKKQRHYLNSLKQVKNKLSESDNKTEEKMLKERQKEIDKKLIEIDKTLKEIDERETNKKAGYIYIISNVGAFGKDVYKIGMTRSLNPIEEIEKMNNTSVPFAFDVHAIFFSENALDLEKKLHRTFYNNQINLLNQYKNFFKLPLQEIQDAISEDYNQSIAFVDDYEAEQFRESEKLRLTLISK